MPIAMQFAPRNPAQADAPRPITLTLSIGVVAAVVSTATCALLVASANAIAPFPRDTSFPGLLTVLKNAALLSPIAAVACGSYGLLAGTVGGALLTWRRRRVHTIRRLLIESSVAGVVLGFLFPFYDVLVNGPIAHADLFILGAPVGLVCAVTCALAFRKRLVS